MLYTYINITIVCRIPEPAEFQSPVSMQRADAAVASATRNSYNKVSSALNTVVTPVVCGTRVCVYVTCETI